MSNDADIGNVIDHLLAFSEGVKVYFASRLYPFEEKMWRKLLLLTHYGVILKLGEEVSHQFAVISLSHKYASLAYLFALLQVDVVQRWISKDWKLVTQPLIGTLIQPFVFWTVTHEPALQPAVNRTVVPSDVVVESGVELVWIEDLDCALLPTRTNWLAFTKVDFYVNHTVREGLKLRVVVSGTIEDKISGLQVLFLQPLIRQQIKLVWLVPLAQRISEFLP